MAVKNKVVTKKKTNTYVATTDRISQAVLTGEAQKRTNEKESLTSPSPEYKTGLVPKTNKPIYVTVEAGFDPEMTSKLTEEGVAITIFAKNLTYFDKAVHNAVLSLIVAGNNYMTTQQILNVMTGCETSEGVHYTAGQLTRVRESLHRLICVNVGFKAEEDSLYLQTTENPIKKYFGPILKIERVIYDANGNETDGYRFMGNVNEEDELPILYQYALSKNQIQSMPVSLLATPGQKNELYIQLQEYLRTRIAPLESNKGKKYTNKILITSVLEALDIKEDDTNRNTFRTVKKRIIAHIDTILTAWAGENGLIDSYTWEYDSVRHHKRAVIIQSKSTEE